MKSFRVVFRLDLQVLCCEFTQRVGWATKPNVEIGKGQNICGQLMLGFVAQPTALELNGALQASEASLARRRLERRVGTSSVRRVLRGLQDTRPRRKSCRRSRGCAACKGFPGRDARPAACPLAGLQRQAEPGQSRFDETRRFPLLKT